MLTEKLGSSWRWTAIQRLLAALVALLFTSADGLAVNLRGEDAVAPLRHLHKHGPVAKASPHQGGQLTFVHNPKCAGSTVEETMKSVGYPVGKDLAESYAKSLRVPYDYWQRLEFNAETARKLLRLPRCEEVFSEKLCAEERWSHSQPGNHSFCSGCPMWHTPPILLQNAEYTTVTGKRLQPDGIYHTIGGRKRDYFTVVKDPLARAVSEYRFRGCPGDMNTFIQSQILNFLAVDICADDCHWMPQAAYIVSDSVQHLIPVEHVEPGLLELISRYKVGNTTRPEIQNNFQHTYKEPRCPFPPNVHTSYIVRKYLDDSTKRLIARLYGSDLELHTNLLKRRKAVVSFKSGSDALRELTYQELHRLDEEGPVVSDINMSTELSLVTSPRIQRMDVHSSDLHVWGLSHVDPFHEETMGPKTKLQFDPRRLHSLLHLPTCGVDWSSCLDTRVSAAKARSLKCSKCTLSKIPPFVLRNRGVETDRRHFVHRANVWEQYVTVVYHPFEEVVSQYFHQKCHGDFNTFVQRALWTLLTEDMCDRDCHMLPQMSYLMLTRVHSVILRDRLRDGLVDLLKHSHSNKTLHVKRFALRDKAYKQCSFLPSTPIDTIINSHLKKRTRQLLERVYHQDLKLYAVLNSAKDNVVTFRHGAAMVDGKTVHIADLLKAPS